MSIDEKKMFVMKHTFTDIINKRSRVFYVGKEEIHFNIPWRIVLIRETLTFNVYLECLKASKDDPWSIDTTINTKILSKTGQVATEHHRVIDKEDSRTAVYLESGALDDYVIDGNLNILECKVTIHKMTGIEIPKEKRIFRIFDDESAKKFSDIVLKVKEQKFYVSKLYLASQSSYFKSLLFGNFDESEQSEVELKIIEPETFQTFLEVLYGDPAIDEDNIEGILQLADMFDAKTVIRQCEQFLLHRSEQTVKIKFDMALKYNMDQLLKKSISELKSVEDIKSVVSNADNCMNNETLKELLNMSIEFHEKK